MMNNIESWRQMLLKLPSDDFFNLMQTWLGEIQTPYNKHLLIEKLEGFLSSEIVRKRIVELIDSTDASILSAIWMLNSPDIPTLYRLCGKNMPFSAFSLKLINLDQRLLIYREQNSSKETIQINPLLIEDLRENVLHLNALFPPVHDFEEVGKIPWLGDSILLAFFSYIENRKPVLKNNFCWKKKDKEELVNIIPQLSGSTAGFTRSELVKSILFSLSLVTIKEGHLINIIPNWLALGNIDSRGIFIKILAAATSIPPETLSSNEEKEEIKVQDTAVDTTITPEHHIANKREPASKETLRDLSTLIINLLRSIPSGEGYSIAHFQNIIELCMPTRIEISTNTIIDILTECEIIIQDSDQNSSLNPILDIDKPMTPPLQGAVIEANFDVILKPWTPFKEALFVPMISDITTCDLYPHYQITKESFSRGLKQGYSENQLIEQMETLTRKPLAQNIKQTMMEWSKNYQRVKLIKGIILIIQPDELNSIEALGLLEPWIIQKLTPNIFLLNEYEKEKWQEALIKSGIESIPAIEDPSTPLSSSGIFNPLDIDKIPRLLKNNNSASHKIDYTQEGLAEEWIHPEQEEIKKEIKSLKLHKDDKEEYMARVHKKLILFSSQILKPSARFEKKEAKGLDYRGKVAVISHAISSKKEILEITVIEATGPSAPILIFPISINKSNQTQILKGTSVETENIMEVDISRIKSVRRLQSALFCPEQQ